MGSPVKENSRLGAWRALWSDGNAKPGTEEWKKCLERGARGRGLCRVTPGHGASRSKLQGSPWAQRVRGGLGVAMLLCLYGGCVQAQGAVHVCISFCNSLMWEKRGGLDLGPVTQAFPVSEPWPPPL